MARLLTSKPLPAVVFTSPNLIVKIRILEVRELHDLCRQETALAQQATGTSRWLVAVSGGFRCP